MKHKGGLPKVFRKEKPKREILDENMNRNVVSAMMRSLPPPRQTIKSGLEQKMNIKPKSPFTGPGPSTAGRRKTRKLKRRF